MTKSQTGLSERLQRAMTVRKMTQRDLGKVAKVDSAHISRLLSGERGGVVRIETQVKLSEALGVPAEWLFFGHGPDPFGAPPPPTEPRGADRFPTRRAAAILLRGKVDPEAIEALLYQQHDDLDADPGIDFWLRMGAEYHEKRQALMSGKALPSQPTPELDEPPPMTARTPTRKKAKRK